MLLSNDFIMKNKNLCPKFGKNGSYVIPSTIVGEGHDNFYLLILTAEDLKKDEIYNID